MTEKRRYDWDIYGVFDFVKDDYLEDSHKTYSDLLNKQEEDYLNVIRAWKELDDKHKELKEENEQLKHNNKMLSMKMSEVSTKYRLLKEFSDDTNPNEAVETVLHELMMITKEYR